MARPHVVIGVCGSIAAFKIAVLHKHLRDHVDVTVAMTPSATQFVGPQTFLALTRNPVITTLWEDSNTKPKHIDLADELDLLLIAPATANILGKAAHGIADEPVSTLIMSVLPNEVPVAFAPAMNTRMWHNPATVANVKLLRERGYHFIEPDSGDLACGWQGEGRLAEPQVIADKVFALLKLDASQPTG
ncbi:MAG: phosphopantothenoylcysteine decarboxylase [Planctomycetes bacterium]|nr:phosphopantothenoylcysteine decarboxylase [Planctomycetota bacterium]MCW8136069.1 phosphopantothenoylcysteine decarboxylase [Planctomycetota bacterium]